MEHSSVYIKADNYIYEMQTVMNAIINDKGFTTKVYNDVLTISW